MKILLLITLLILGGCQTAETPEQVQAEIENKRLIIEAGVKPGKDARCLEFMGFKGCYTKERTEQ